MKNTTNLFATVATALNLDARFDDHNISHIVTVIESCGAFGFYSTAVAVFLNVGDAPAMARAFNHTTCSHIRAFIAHMGYKAPVSRAAALAKLGEIADRHAMRRTARA